MSHAGTSASPQVSRRWRAPGAACIRQLFPLASIQPDCLCRLRREAGRIAALFPGTTDAFLSMRSQMMKAAARFVANGPKAGDEVKSEPKKEQQTVHQKKAS